MGFFYTHFVLSGAGVESGSDVCTSAPPSCALDSHLLSTMQTVGLAALANATYDPRVMKEARVYYIEAIRSTNKALQSLVEAKKDSSLLAVMLLTTFETIANRSLEAWAKHVEGTVALIKLRGSEQFSTTQGVRLFAQATQSLVVKCQYHGLALPADLLDLEAEAARYSDTNDPAWRYHAVMMSFTNFWAAWKSQRIRNPEACLAKALDLDWTSQLIFANASPAWDYKTFQTYAHSRIALFGCYHVYPNYMVAQIWNGMRSIRILLNAIIRRALLEGFSTKPPLFREPEHTAQFQASTDTLRRLQCDIIASTPQHLGHLPKQYSPASTKLQGTSAYQFPWSHFERPVIHNPFHRLTSSRDPPQLPMIRIFGGYALPLSVYMAGATDVASEVCRSWAIDTLRSIGHEMGTQQAHLLADTLASKSR